LGDFSILFCRQQAVDFDLRMKNEWIFSLKFVGMVKCVKIPEFSEDTLFRPTFKLSFAGQWPWFPSIEWCRACCPCSVNCAAAGQQQLCVGSGDYLAIIMPCCDVTTGHYYSHLMTTAHTCCWQAVARFTEHGQVGIVTCYRPASSPTGHAPCSVKGV